METLKNIVAKIQAAIRKALAAFSPVVADGAGTRLMAGCCFAAVLLAGCSPRHMDVLMNVAPKDGGEGFQVVVQVPHNMRQGSSEVVIGIENDVYRGKMVCTRGGFEVKSQETFGFIGWGGLHGDERAGSDFVDSRKVIDSPTVCRATLISGNRSLQCELSGGSTDVTGIWKELAQTWLLIPTFGLSYVALPDDYMHYGAGECRKSDGAVYAVRIVGPPGEE